MPGQEDGAGAARLPDDVSIIAFGDVHGCFDKLEPLLERIAARAAASPQRRHIAVSVGDLVDRGPDSALVVDRLAGGLPGCELVVLRGNHEAMMLDFLRSGEGAENWLRNGGLHTLASYGVDLATMAAEGVGADGLRRAFLERLPARHLSFLLASPLSFACGDYFFVHAGVKPGVPLHAQSPDDLRWIRAEFLDHRDGHEKMIVHGHNISENVDERSNRIGIDTGAYRSGRLTAIGLQGTARWFLQTGVECAA